MRQIRVDLVEYLYRWTRSSRLRCCRVIPPDCTEIEGEIVYFVPYDDEDVMEEEEEEEEEEAAEVGTEAKKRLEMWQRAAERAGLLPPDVAKEVQRLREQALRLNLMRRLGIDLLYAESALCRGAYLRLLSDPEVN